MSAPADNLEHGPRDPGSTGSGSTGPGSTGRSSTGNNLNNGSESAVVLAVDTSADGVRLDRFLAEHFPRQSRAHLQRVIQDGRVLVDGAQAKPSTHLRCGSQVSVRLPPPPAKTPLPENIDLTILYDDSMIVIDKPPDRVVHSSPGVKKGGSIVNALVGYTKELSSEGGPFRPGIVHRLDRETSGVLVVARDDQAHRAIQDQFRARTVHKEYVAAVHNIPKATEGLVDQPLARSTHNRRKMTVRHDEEAKESQTEWALEHTLGNFAWLRLHPRTGRTHQIRVHLKTIGHPILCDALYGLEKSFTRSELEGRKPTPDEPPLLERHALHAHRLRLRHPADGREIEFVAPLPPDMASIYAMFLAGGET